MWLEHDVDATQLASLIRRRAIATVLAMLQGYGAKWQQDLSTSETAFRDCRSSIAFPVNEKKLAIADLMDRENLRNCFKAVLVVLIGTMAGHYFRDLDGPNVLASACAVLAIKYLSSFNWVWTILTYIFIAGMKNTGGHVPTFIVGRCIIFS